MSVIRIASYAFRNTQILRRVGFGKGLGRGGTSVEHDAIGFAFQNGHFLLWCLEISCNSRFLATTWRWQPRLVPFKMGRAHWFLRLLEEKELEKKLTLTLKVPESTISGKTLQFVGPLNTKEGYVESYVQLPESEHYWILLRLHISVR